MKIPKAIIPVHTCELGGHQSISHTLQQNRVPHEPINLLCNALNGCIYGASRFQKDAQKANMEPRVEESGAPAPAQERETGLRNSSSHQPFGALKYSNEEFKWPLKAFVFRGRAAKAHSPLLSQPAGGASINPQPDPGGGIRRRSPRKRETVVIVCETSVGFGGRCIIMDCCHLPNCSKRASSPPQQ